MRFCKAGTLERGETAENQLELGTIIDKVMSHTHATWKRPEICLLTKRGEE